MKTCGKVAFLKLARIVSQLDFFRLKLWRLLVVGNEVIDNFFLVGGAKTPNQYMENWLKFWGVPFGLDLV